MSSPNWIHLDLKGAIPAQSELLRWLDWLKTAGFNGIVWEYEDRFPWQSWSQTFRDGYSLEEWQQIWQRCDELGFAVAPLVQTHGHLEWLLEHDEYADWREDGHLNEVCPCHPDVLPAMKKWLDEVIALHPQSEFIHVGGDETWNLGSCPQCREIAAASPLGKIAIFLQHTSAICQHVIAHGKKPMIWADAFWPEETRSLVKELPRETVLVDWQYGWHAPLAVTPIIHPSGPKVEVTPGISHVGYEVWAASAIRCSFGQIQLVAPIGERVENVEIWRPQADDGRVAGVIHTVWARTHSLGLLYGPWDGWLPAFIAAGDGVQWENHALRPLVEKMDAAMVSGKVEAIVKELGEIEGDEWTLRCARWWILALRHRVIQLVTVNWKLHSESLLAAQQFRGADLEALPKIETERQKITAALDVWESDARAFWRELTLSDEDEYFACRAGSLRSLLVNLNGL